MIQVMFYTDNKTFMVDALDKYTTTKHKRSYGKLRANKAEFEISNLDNLFVWDLSANAFMCLVDEEYEPIPFDTKVEIYVDGALDFTGFVNPPEEKMDSRVISFEAYDAYKFIDEAACEEKPYLDNTFDDILKDILSQCGYTGSLSKIYTINNTIDYCKVDKDTKATDVLKDLVESVAGNLWVDKHGDIVFDGGYLAYKGTTPSYPVLATVTDDDVNNFYIRQNKREYDQINIKAKPFIKNDAKEWVYIGATPDEPIVVGTETEKDFTVEFDKLTYYAVPFESQLSWFSQLFNTEKKEFTFHSTDSGKVWLDETTYNNNFYNLSTGILKNPKQMKMKLNTSGAYTGVQVTEFMFMGKTIEEQTYDVILGDAPTGRVPSVLEIENPIIQTEDWAEELAEWYKQLMKETYTVKMNLLDKNVGNNLQIDSCLRVILPKAQIDAEFVVDSVYYNYDKGTYEVELTKLKSEWQSSTEYRSVSILKKPIVGSDSAYFYPAATLFEDLSADGKLTAVEKLQFQPTYESILQEYPSIIDNANTYGVSSTNYTNKYNTLVAYINGVDLYNKETSDIDRDIFNTNFKEYYDTREVLLKDISIAAEIRIEGAEDKLSDIAADNKLTPNEKLIVKKEWERIQAEYTTTLITADAYYIDTINYQDAYAILNSYITPLLSSLTTTDNINRSTFNNKFNAYYAALKNIIDNTSVKINEDITQKQIKSGTNIFRLGKNAISLGGGQTADGLNIGSGGQLLVGDSTTSDKMMYYNGTDLIIKGGVLEATNAMIWSDTDINLTVGSGGDFSTLNEAFEHLSKYMLVSKADNTSLDATVQILSGTTIDYFVKIENTNLSWVRVTSVDSVVPVNTIALDSSGYTRFMSVSNAKAPVIDCQFESTSTSTSVGGVLIIDNSHMVIQGGFSKFDINVLVTDNSSVELNYANLSYATSKGLSVHGGSRAHAFRVDFALCAPASVNVGYHSNAMLRYCNFTTAGAVVISGGSMIFGEGNTSVQYSIPTNVITDNGIVFENSIEATRMPIPKYAGTPPNVTDGDIWYNSSNGRVYIKRNGIVDRFIMASEF